MQRTHRIPYALRKAIINGDDERASAILSQPKFQQREWINAVSRGGKTILLFALGYKRYQIAQQIIDNTEADLNATCSHRGMTRGILELCYGNKALCRRIVTDERKSIISITEVIAVLDILLDLYGRNKNISYNEEIHLEIVKCLLEKGTYVNACFNPCMGFLGLAAQRNLVGLAQYLLSMPGIDVNRGLFLHFAAGKGSLDVVRLLLAHPKIDVNAVHDGFRSEHGGLWSPMKWALRSLSDEQKTDVKDAIHACAKELLCHPDISDEWLKNNKGHNYLHLDWFKSENPDLFRQILHFPDTKIVVDYDSRYSPTPNTVSIRIDFRTLISFLVDNPDFDINVVFPDGDTLLIQAKRMCIEDAIAMLLSCPRLDLHSQDPFDHSALVTAERWGLHDLADQIMQNPRYDYTKTYHLNRNLLMHVAAQNCPRLVQKLLEENRYPVNAQDDEGNSALILLCQNHQDKGDSRIFDIMLRSGADPLQKNNNGFNAIMVAKYRDLKGIAYNLKHYNPYAESEDSIPSAPPAENTIDLIEAASVPPGGYYQQGLFGGSNQREEDRVFEKIYTNPSMGK